MDEIRSVCLSLVAEDGAEREREVNRGVTKREDGVDSSSESRSHRGFVGVNSRICFPHLKNIRLTCFFGKRYFLVSNLKQSEKFETKPMFF